MSDEFRLRRETEAAKDLVRSLKAMDLGDDAELVADSVEGETRLHEAVEAVVAEIDETEILVNGLKAKEKQFGERRRTMEVRIERLRALIEQAMTACETETLRLPSATLSLRRSSPAAVVVNEAEIPSEFFVPQPAPPPRLDKRALLAALQERDVPGATKSNGGMSLTIRRA